MSKEMTGLERIMYMNLSNSGITTINNLYIATEKMATDSRYKLSEPQIGVYEFAMKKDSYLKFIFNSDQSIDIELHVDEDTVALKSESMSYRTFMNKIKEMDELMDKHALTFAPAYDNAFENDVMNAKPGEVLLFGTNMAVACVSASENKLVFRSQFEGKMEHLKLESFLNGNEYIVTKNDKASIQKFYNASYDALLDAAVFKHDFDDKSGEQRISEIEQRVIAMDSKFEECFIGPIHLRVANKDDAMIWYDSNGMRIDREKVATIFGWANTSIANISVRATRSACFEPPLFDTVNSSEELICKKQEFARQIAYLANTGNYSEIPDIAFKYEQKTKEPLVLNISGLEPDENGNFEAKTYTFSNGKIIEITYADNDFSNIIESVKECEKQKFLCFMEQKYDDGIVITERNHPYNKIIENSKNRQSAGANHIHYWMEKDELILKSENVSVLDDTSRQLIQSFAADCVKDTLSVSEIINETGYNNCEEDVGGFDPGFDPADD